MAVALAHDPEKGRRAVGAALYVALMLSGAAILVYYFLLPPLWTKNPDVRYEAMGMGALLAFPPLLVYLWLPWVIDRFDPEPWWALALALAWGAVAACGFSALINTNVEMLAIDLAGGPKSKHALAVGQAVGACLSAPLTEELWKGLAVFGVFFFVRREFDGVVDGIIYATFVALGFAATENVVYYARAGLEETLKHKHGLLGITFVLRGVLAPWGHPLYTSMTGLGFGIARETSRPWLRWAAPIGGYLTAAFLHFVWNGAATLSGVVTLVMLPLWFLFVLLFVAMVVALVFRKGRIIKENLRDEVLIGTLTQQELDMVVSPFGRWKARSSYGGAAGKDFVAAAARLGLCKWHAARAMKGQKRTVSMDFIAPLRQELARLRKEVYARLGRPVPAASAPYANLAAPPAPPPPPGAPMQARPGAPIPQTWSSPGQAGYGPPAGPGYGPPAGPGYGPPAGPGYGPPAPSGYGPQGTAIHGVQGPGYGPPPGPQGPAAAPQGGSQPAPGGPPGPWGPPGPGGRRR
jgi:RsiW-degrading membrane proteinase PrsW (M82 family)